jgi:hypothetical protein
LRHFSRLYIWRQRIQILIKEKIVASLGDIKTVHPLFIGISQDLHFIIAGVQFYGNANSRTFVKAGGIDIAYAVGVVVMKDGACELLGGG